MADEPEPSPSKLDTAGPGFLLAMLATILLAFGYLTYGPGLDNAYVGFGALLAIPFALGALATGLGYPYSTIGCLLAPVALFAILFPFVYFGLAEGLVCIMMVLPFWVAAGLGGGLAAYLYQRRKAEEAGGQANNGNTRLKMSAALTIPFAVILAEEMAPPQWQAETVSRSVVIDASADEVWPMLLAVPDIAEREGHWTFTHDVIGIPRPSHAEIVKKAGKTVRKAQWGEHIRFEEHVDKVVPGQKISWNFVFPDGSVQAHTDQHIDPDGPVLKIARGGYELREMDDGAVELTLSTRYRMRTRLGWYFRIWGEVLLGDVHDNVLAVIKDRAEGTNSPSP